MITLHNIIRQRVTHIYIYKKNAYALKTPHVISVQSYSSISSLASPSMKASMNSESHSFERPIETFLDPVTLIFDL